MTTKQLIGLIAAMKEESAALLRLAQPVKRIKLGSFRAFKFELSGQECVLLTSGMGMRRAREATRCLLESASPRLLISFGIAGAVEPELEIGDVVTAGSVCMLVGGAHDLAQPLAVFPEESMQAMQAILAQRNARLFAGTAVTTAGSQLPAERAVEMKHPILEMETAGIAQAAAEKGIPLFSIRAISDGPKAPMPIDLGEIMDEDANYKIGKMLLALIRNPGMLLQARRLMRNTRIAADNAAVALVAALEGMPPFST
jgi:adenosylhomocysteine nucleosidase